MVTGTTQSILERATSALERGLGPAAAQLLTPVLHSSTLSREDELSVRAALAEAWLLQDDLTQAATSLGRTPDSMREPITDARLSTLWRLHGRITFARGEQSRAIALHARALNHAELAHDSRAIGLAHYELKRFSNRPCTTWGGRGTSARTDAGGPMRAYSMDLRERALLDSDAGMTAAEVAAKYRVSGSWVRLLKQRRRDTGEVAPRVQRHGRRGMLEPHLHTLAALIAAHPDRTLAELKDALATPASVPTVWRAVRALGLTVKKHGPPVRTRSA